MAQFVFLYRVPTGYVPGGPEASQAWQSWFNEMGAGVIDLGKPVLASAVVGTCEGDVRLGGYSVVEADDMDAARQIAGGCPALGQGGGVEVGALVAVSELQELT
jgi:hypothetical protein